MAIQGMGGFIRERREAQKLSLRAFAEKLGISAAHQSDIEHDRRRPSSELMKKMAEVLAIDLAELEQRDARLSSELKEFVDKNPKIAQLLREIRDSGRSVDDLVVAWRTLQAESKPK